MSDEWQAYCDKQSAKWKAHCDAMNDRWHVVCVRMAVVLGVTSALAAWLLLDRIWSLLR